MITIKSVSLFTQESKQLKQMILFMLRDAVWAGAHCEFYQFSQGMQVVYSRQTHSFREFSLNGIPIEDQQIYKVGMQHYHFLNLESFFSIKPEEIAANGEPSIIATSCQDILDEYLSSHQNLDRAVCGRLVVE